MEQATEAAVRCYEEITQALNNKREADHQLQQDSLTEWDIQLPEDAFTKVISLCRSFVPGQTSVPTLQEFYQFLSKYTIITSPHNH